MAQPPGCLLSPSPAIHPKRSQIEQSRKWQPPENNQFKCNCDAAVRL